MTSATAQAEKGLRDQIAAIVGNWPRIVCFANDWNGDPTSKHHIMRTYSAATDVVLVESSGMRRPKLSSLIDLQRITQRIARAAGSATRQPEGRLRIASPLGLPLPGNPVATRVNALLFRRAVRRASAGMKEGKPLLWVYTPTVAPYLSSFPNSGIVYHCVDRWWAFGDYDTDLMLEFHESLCRQADVVFASGAALLEDCRAYSENAHLVPHGVEWAHFARAVLEEPARPADIADIRTPIVGFFGMIHEWLDQPLLADLAKAIPNVTIVLIGKVWVDVSLLRRCANIRFVGQKPYSEMPAYAAAFDVGIVPFVVNDLTLAVNPIKLREYLSAGLPVVATALPEIRALADMPHVHVTESRQEFSAAVRAHVAAPPSREARTATALAMASESWSGRCLDMARHVEAARTG
jgi:glycosyltransferase involved in cell wall biosynthesis